MILEKVLNLFGQHLVKASDVLRYEIRVRQSTAKSVETKNYGAAVYVSYPGGSFLVDGEHLRQLIVLLSKAENEILDD